MLYIGQPNKNKHEHNQVRERVCVRATRLPFRSCAGVKHERLFSYLSSAIDPNRNWTARLSRMDCAGPLVIILTWQRSEPWTAQAWIFRRPNLRGQFRTLINVLLVTLFGRITYSNFELDCALPDPGFHPIRRSGSHWKCLRLWIDMPIPDCWFTLLVVLQSTCTVRVVSW